MTSALKCGVGFLVATAIACSTSVPSPATGDAGPAAVDCSDLGAAAPWDAGGIGEQECPRAPDGGCPECCPRIVASRIDRTRHCEESPEFVACGRPQAGGGGQALCVSNGQDIFAVADEPLVEPYFVGWRSCTDAEQADFNLTGQPCL